MVFEDSSKRDLSLLKKVGSLLLNFEPFAEEALFYGFQGKILLKLVQIVGLGGNLLLLGNSASCSSCSYMLVKAGGQR